MEGSENKYAFFAGTFAPHQGHIRCIEKLVKLGYTAVIAIIPNGGTRKPHTESLAWREKWTLQAIGKLHEDIRDRIDVIVGDNVEAKINNLRAYFESHPGVWHGVVGSDNGIFKPGSAAAPFYLTAQPNRYEDAESEDDERLSCVVTVVGFILLIRNDPDIPSVDPAKTTVDGSAKFPQTNPPRPIVQRILIEESSVMSSSLMRRYARNELKKTDPTPEVILANLSIPTDEIIKEYSKPKYGSEASKVFQANVIPEYKKWQELKKAKSPDASSARERYQTALKAYKNQYAD